MSRPASPPSGWDRSTGERKGIDGLTAHERKQVYVSLYQTHVPGMADAGIVDYESNSGEIVPRAEIFQLKHYLTP